MRTGESFIINLAPTGVIPTRAMSPYVPLSESEIIDDVAKALALGVQMVHLHARDVSLANEFERPLATRAQVRQRLGLETRTRQR